MVFVGLGSSLWMLVAFAILGRIGLGFILQSLNTGLTCARSDKSLISQGSSAIGFLRMLGGAAGVSLCGSVLEWRARCARHGASVSCPELATRRASQRR